MHFAVALLSLEDYTALPFVSPVTAKGLMNRERNVSTRFRTSAWFSSFPGKGSIQIETAPSTRVQREDDTEQSLVSTLHEFFGLDEGLLSSHCFSYMYYIHMVSLERAGFWYFSSFRSVMFC